MVSQSQDVAGANGGWERSAESTPLGDDDPELDLVWRCMQCGYQRMSAEPPEGCAACGAPRDQLMGHTSVQWRMLLRHAARETGEQSPA